jgi:hypothetical protein
VAISFSVTVSPLVHLSGIAFAVGPELLLGEQVVNSSIGGAVGKVPELVLGHDLLA